MDSDDELLWLSGQATVVLDEHGGHLKFKKEASLYGYLSWLINNKKI